VRNSPECWAYAFSCLTVGAGPGLATCNWPMLVQQAVEEKSNGIRRIRAFSSWPMRRHSGCLVYINKLFQLVRYKLAVGVQQMSNKRGHTSMDI
jgi:hypothetical protein